MFDEAVEDLDLDKHVRDAREALKTKNGLLTAWEVSFLASMLHIRFPSPKQLSTLSLLVAKVRMPRPSGRALRRARYAR